MSDPLAGGLVSKELQNAPNARTFQMHQMNRCKRFLRGGSNDYDGRYMDIYATIRITINCYMGYHDFETIIVHRH